jgi:hypothetical protein
LKLPIDPNQCEKIRDTVYAANPKPQVTSQLTQGKMDTQKLTELKTGKTTVMTFAQTPKQNSAALLLLS